MGRAKVAIVGRPNVGKSSLLNYLSGHRSAIVTPTSGTTRDSVRSIIKHEERAFDLIDTGGMGMDQNEPLTADVEQRIERAITEADLVLLLVDVRAGLQPGDSEIARFVRKRQPNLLLVANKVDTQKLETGLADFAPLGFELAIPVSALEKSGRGMLLDTIVGALPPEDEDAPEENKPQLKIAIVGKRNTGKSTFANALLNEERMIVSDIPGTTRDSVDLLFERDGETFMAIDTAGLRRRVRIDSQIEYYSAHRTERAIRRADVVLFFLDAAVDISQVDMKICRYIVDQFKPCVLVVNKWDLADETISTGQYADYLTKKLRGVSFAPIVFISAKEGDRIMAAVDLGRGLAAQAAERVGTTQLNGALDRFRTRPLKAAGGKKAPKIYFGAQVSSAPPLIVLAVNDPRAFSAAHVRTIERHLREELPFAEVPIQVRLRDHHK